MKAFEVTGTIDEKGQLILDRPLTLDTPGPVRIIESHHRRSYFC